MSMGSGGMFGDIGQFEMPQMPQLNVPPPKPKKGGMFGSGVGFGEALVHALNGYLASQGNPVGAMNMQMIHQRQGEKQRQAMEEQQYQRQRSDGMQDWMAKQEYAQQHQGPDPLAQMMMQAGIDPASPQGQQMYQQALQNKVNPFTQMRVQNPDGSETLQFMRPPSVPTAPVGGLVPIDDEQGGPRPLGVGGFPGSF